MGHLYVRLLSLPDYSCSKMINQISVAPEHDSPANVQHLRDTHDLTYCKEISVIFAAILKSVCVSRGKFLLAVFILKWFLPSIVEVETQL